MIKNSLRLKFPCYLVVSRNGLEVNLNIAEAQKKLKKLRTKHGTFLSSTRLIQMQSLKDVIEVNPDEFIKEAI